MKVFALLLLAASMFPFVLNAQITNRKRPASWDSLVAGGRYVDRFLPMPDGKLSGKVWGAKEVLPRFVDNGIESDKLSFWGGNIKLDAKGLYHLYVCGWSERMKKGHMYWPNSTVFHTTSRSLHGPYAIIDTIGPGHNPEAFTTADGRTAIFVIGGYYVSNSLNGPWVRRKFDFDRRDRRIIEGLSNLTFAPRQDGSVLMVCRGGGIWISRDGVSPFRQVTIDRAYPKVEGEFEDPVVWRDSLQYHLIVNDWKGRIAFYERSLDGVNWVVEQGEAYVPGISRHKDGKVENWFKYERAKVFQDKEGRVAQMNFAVIDTIKWEDLGGDNHSSKNICIPMKKDLLLEVLNTEPIDNLTLTIDLRIKAEKGFRPVSDLDIASLRLGTYTEVNFGRGARPVSWKKVKEVTLLSPSMAVGAALPRKSLLPSFLERTKRVALFSAMPACPMSTIVRPSFPPNVLCTMQLRGFGKWKLKILACPFQSQQWSR